MQNLRIDGEELAGACHRIGAVSRLAGVPVTTLRVWEARYAAFTPGKSSGRHRLYSDADVIKARLMRQLAAAGHSVGGIAHLPAGQLQQMLAAATGAAAAPRAAPRVSIAVVGAGIAARISAPEWRHRYLGEALDVRQVFAGLHEVRPQAGGDAGSGGGIGILLVRLNAIHAGALAQLNAAIGMLLPQRVIVLYNYGAAPLVAALQAVGTIVRREPIPDAELAQLIRAVVLVDPAEAMPELGPGALIPPRRYSEATLARVAASPSAMLCECPRHIAELIGQLASFEEYSEACLNMSHEDAQVHAQLRAIAGSARALFEHGLQLVARHGGLALDEDATARS